jgi:hypothetical protein
VPLRRLLVAALLLLGLPGVAPAQFKDREPEGLTLGDARVQRLQIGMTVTAVGGVCRNIVGYAPIPDEWPEQRVKIVKEEVPPGARLNYRSVDGMAKVMQVRIATLAAGDAIEILVTFEVERSEILPPEKPELYVLPDLLKLDRDVRKFLSESPKIESRDPRIRAKAKEILAEVEGESAWRKVEAIYDWVRDNVEYRTGSMKGAVAALRDGTGDCEELTSLFIALCRAGNIPARTVWVHGHCYPEFYLTDAEGKGYWFPCQAAGTRAFGEIPETRAILQKGDNIHPPHDPRTTQRYMAEHLTGTSTGADPRVKFIRKTVSE